MDNDKGVNGQVKYSIVQQPNQKGTKFTVDEETGEVFTNKVFDREGEDGKTVYVNDDAWNVFSNVKGTPKYFKVRKDEFIAKVVNLGPFSWFFTLSCADYHYSENFTALLQDHTISYYFDFEAGEEMCLIDGLSIEEFLKQHESKHEFIRKNILTATRHWEHRLKQFIEVVIKNALGPMCVKYYQTRIEFQLR